MKIHEYQAIDLLEKYNIPVTRGLLVTELAEAEAAVKKLAGMDGVNSFVVKAQVHAGGRGKAGGVKLAADKEMAVQHVKDILGMQLSTKQTGSASLKVRKVLVSEAVAIEREFYVAITLDRSSAKNVIITSTEGGTEIEEIAKSNPEKIIKQWIDPLTGPKDYQLRLLCEIFELDKNLSNQLKNILRKLYQLYIDTDASIVEINPLVLTKDNRILAIDAKISFDDNAMYRNPAIFELRDLKEENEAEVEASKYDLNYIKLDGTIGCMVNGAGLAMATMDIIKIKGGNPANFLDVGGGATPETVKNGFKIILSDKNVESVLVNIFGGIVRCDRIANGILDAVKELSLSVPIVIRLEGTNSDVAAEIIKNSGISVISANSFADAAEKAVAAAN
jgi:succinyl-CoA synthetase beta subunit